MSLKTFLAYKLKEQGKQLVVMDKWYPSGKTGHLCGTINNHLTLAGRVWTRTCGAVQEEDTNAVIK